jgi:nucleotide-binding universal stress UspA family protein
MFNRILVPLDGSERAEQALPVAARLARAAGSTVLLVRVVTPNYTAFYWPYDLSVDPFQATLPAGVSTAAETERSGAQEYLTQIAKRPALAGLPVETLLLSGVAGPTLLQTIEDQQPDLVLISSHGRTGLSRWVLGSVAQHLVRHAPAPILVLRAPTSAADSGLAALSHPTHVVVTLDGSTVAESVLTPATDLCVALSGTAPGELHLLLVVFQFAAPPDAANRALLIAGAQGYLQRVKASLERDYAQSLRITTSVTSGWDIAATILQVAEHGEDSPVKTAAGAFDVLAMATHGTTGFDRWALGSVTERVLSGSRIPLLVVRPRKITSGASPLAATLP